MKRNVSVVRFKFRCNILISGKIIKEMPSSVASGTHCIIVTGMHSRPLIFNEVKYVSRGKKTKRGNVRLT